MLKKKRRESGRKVRLVKGRKENFEKHSVF